MKTTRPSLCYAAQVVNILITQQLEREKKYIKYPKFLCIVLNSVTSQILILVTHNSYRKQNFILKRSCR